MKIKKNEEGQAEHLPHGAPPAGGTPAPHFPATGGGAGFEAGATAVLSELQRAVADLLGSAPKETGRAADVQRTFAIDYRLAWQVHQVATAGNPLAAAEHIPPRASVQRLLRSASRRRIPAGVVRRVTEAYDRFEKFTEAEAADRAEMEAMISAFLPETREKKELAARQAAFRAMSQIRGMAMEADLMALLLWPSNDGVSLDRATLTGELGLRRMSPDAHIVIGTGDQARPDQAVRTLDDRPVEGPAAVPSLLPQFSSTPLPRLETQVSGGMVYYRIAGDDVGLRSAVNLVLADQRRAATRRYREPDGPSRAGVFRVIDTPTGRMTVDVFLHDQVFPGIAPDLVMYNIVERGIVRAEADPTREIDRLHPHDIIRPIAGGLARARLPHVPAYPEMLGHVCAKLGLDPKEFRGFRLDVQYPVYGAQYVLGFPLAERPAGG